jgi:microcystin-dependent protein
MAEPFLSEIRTFSFNFPPRGWAECNGQLLPINQNQALFSLLGTTYGGDGRVTFGLPDLRGRVPLREGAGRTLGERGGEEAHTLSIAEVPTHSHALRGTPKAATVDAPGNNFLAASPGTPYTASSSSLVPLNAATVKPAGESRSHENRQPYLVLSLCIALQGIYPSRN